MIEIIEQILLYIIIEGHKPSSDYWWYLSIEVAEMYDKKYTRAK